MQKLVWQNADGVELDLTSGNYGITEWEGFSNTGLNIQSQQVPFQDGGLFLDALIEQRELSVTLAIQDRNNLELRYQQRRELISALNPKLGEGYLIYTNDFISKRIKCIPQIPIFETHNSDMSGTPKATLTWTACEPYWEDLEETTVTFKGVQTVENNGDIPVQIKGTIPFVSKNPVLMNSRNNKMIGLEGSIKNTAIINTNVGEKSVVGEKMGFQWERGGTFDLTISKYGKTYYFGSAVTLEENEMTGILSISDYVLRDIPIGSIAYGNGVFVGVGDNKAYTSFDGVNWTLRQSEMNVSYVYFVNDRFIAVGGYIWSSFDGVTWESATSVGGSGGLEGVAYGNGKYLAVGFTTSTGHPVQINPNIQQSTDGDTWTSVSIQGRPDFGGIAYGNGVFVVFCYTNSANIRTTTDGSSWTTHQFSEDIHDIIFENGLFVTVGSGGVIRTSPDGNTWTIRDSGVENNLTNITYQNGKFVVCGYECILESQDGIEWSIKYGGEEYDSIQSFAHNEDILVGVGSYSAISSPDGNTWTKRESFTDSTGLFRKVIWANNMFIAVGGYTSPKVITSIDGIEWTNQTGVAGDVNLNSIAYGNGLFVAIGDRTSSNIALVITSPDGVTWTQRTTIMAGEMEDIVYHNGLFVAVGSLPNSSEGVIFTSEDGITWTQRYTNGAGFNHIVYGDNKFVVTGGAFHTRFFVSTDGITWNQVAEVETVADNIHYANNVFIATRGWNYIFASSDGMEWQQIDTKIWSGLVAIDYYNGRWYVGGSNGIICRDVNTGETVNLITSLIPDSDMTFNLETGTNGIMFSDNNGKEITITYRQKYIGV
jgi:hypothetical protein